MPKAPAATTLKDPIATLKADHIKVRDGLLDLIDATGKRNAVKSLEILIRLDRITGPHFRFEEESLYPSLEKFFGKEYYEYLLQAHDRVIRTAKQLATILGSGEINEKQGKELPGIIRTQVLPHPIECEGLTLFAERLTKKEVEKIAKNLQAAEKENVTLLNWADTIRTRKV